MDVAQWGDRAPACGPGRALGVSCALQLALARDLRDADLMLNVLEAAGDLPDEHRRLLRAEAGVGLVRLGEFADARQLLREIVTGDPEVERPDAHVYYAQSLYRAEGATADALDEAERVLKQVLLKRQTHPEVHALLGAVAKRRLLQHADRDTRRPTCDSRSTPTATTSSATSTSTTRASTLSPRLGVALGPTTRPLQGPASSSRPYASRPGSPPPRTIPWAAATLAECTLHERLLGLSDEPDAVRSLPPRATAAPSGRYAPWHSWTSCATSACRTPLAEARAGLLEGAGREFSR